jgi:general secretion pathway protein K
MTRKNQPATSATRAPQRQRGAALIMALIIVAIAMILTTSLVWHSHLDLRRVTNQVYSGQAIAYAIGAEDWVRDILARDDRNIDHLGEPWASSAARFPIEGGTLVGQITDLQGRFNLNNLYDPAQEAPRESHVTAFRELLALTGSDENIADALLDWQDPDIEPSGFGGAEDSAYSRRTPPYLTPNAALSSPSELRAVANVTPEMYSALQELVAAIPDEGNLVPVNVNTAPPLVLQAIGNELTEADAAAILQYREQGGIASLDELDNLIGENKLPADHFSVQSSWFLLTVRAEIGSTSVTMYSVLRRDPTTGVVRTVARTLGTY